MLAQIPRFSQHIPLWLEYTFLFVFLVLLLPCLWVSYIWDQIIDPHYEMDQIQEPESRLLRLFYRMAKRINTSLTARTSIFGVVAALVVTSALLDVVRTKERASFRKNGEKVPAASANSAVLFLADAVRDTINEEEIDEVFSRRRRPTFFNLPSLQFSSSLSVHGVLPGREPQGEWIEDNKGINLIAAELAAAAAAAGRNLSKFVMTLVLSSFSWRSKNFYGGKASSPLLQPFPQNFFSVVVPELHVQMRPGHDGHIHVPEDPPLPQDLHQRRLSQLLRPHHPRDNPNVGEERLWGITLQFPSLWPRFKWQQIVPGRVFRVRRGVQGRQGEPLSLCLSGSLFPLLPDHGSTGIWITTITSRMVPKQFFIFSSTSTCTGWTTSGSGSSRRSRSRRRPPSSSTRCCCRTSCPTTSVRAEGEIGPN